MSFVEVSKVNQIAKGTMKSFAVGNKQILVANVDGKFYAIKNTCTHRGGNLSMGKLEGKIVTCQGAIVSCPFAPGMLRGIMWPGGKTP